MKQEENSMTKRIRFLVFCILTGVAVFLCTNFNVEAAKPTTKVKKYQGYDELIGKIDLSKQTVTQDTAARKDADNFAKSWNPKSKLIEVFPQAFTYHGAKLPIVWFFIYTNNNDVLITVVGHNGILQARLIANQSAKLTNYLPMGSWDSDPVISVGGLMKKINIDGKIKQVELQKKWRLWPGAVQPFASVKDSFSDFPYPETIWLPGKSQLSIEAGALFLYGPKKSYPIKEQVDVFGKSMDGKLITESKAGRNPLTGRLEMSSLAGGPCMLLKSEIDSKGKESFVKGIVQVKEFKDGAHLIFVEHGQSAWLPDVLSPLLR
jgi:hypothetical protein